MQGRAVKTRSKILLAAAAVIRRDGAARLTLENVADEADVSKGGLLYHFASKEHLIAELSELTFFNSAARIESYANANDSQPGNFVRSYLESARLPYNPDVDHDISSSILAAATLDKRLLKYSGDRFQQWQERLVEDGIDETVALLARVVADGLCLLDSFDLAPLTEEQRGAVVDLVQSLIDDNKTGSN